MSDVMTPEQRSRCMARIRGRDTKPEVLLRKELWRRGLRYRLRCRLPGRPDLVVTKFRVAVFVDGCFWHGCPTHGARPKSNREFWCRKLSRNMERDREVNERLKSMGWKVIRIWEHEVKDDLRAAASRVEAVISG